MGRGRRGSLVQDVREIAAQQPGKAYDFLQDATSVFEQSSFSQSSGTTPSTLSRTGLLTLVSPSQSPLLNEDNPKCEAFPSLVSNDGAAGPSLDAVGWFPGAQLQEFSSEPPSYVSRPRPRRLKRVYLTSLAGPQPAAPVSVISVRSALSSSSSRYRRLTPVNLRVASSTGHGSAGSPVHRPLVAQDMCDECLLDGEEASSVTVLAEETQADVLLPHLALTDIKTIPAPCMQATAAQPLHIVSPSKPIFPRCQSLPAYSPSHVVNYRSPSLARLKAMSIDPATPASSDIAPAATTAGPVPTPMSVPQTSQTGATASCRVSLKLHSSHVELFRLDSLRALAQLLLPFGWALRGMGVRPGCIELVLDYTRVEVDAQGTDTRADAGASAADRGAPSSTTAHADAQTKDAGAEVGIVSEQHLTQLVSFLHQQGLVDESAEPCVFLQANQQLHRVQWQQQSASGQLAQQAPELAARVQKPGALLGSAVPQAGDPGAGAVFRKADASWMCVGGPTLLGPAAGLEPVVLPPCVTASCGAEPSAGVVLYVGVPRRGLQDCTVRSLGRFLPTRELLRVSALAAMAAFDMATITEDAPTDAALVAGKVPSGVPYIAHVRDGGDGTSFTSGAGNSSSNAANGSEPLNINWLLAGAAAQAAGVDGEVLVLSVSELPVYGTLLQVELRLPPVGGRTGSLTPVSWRTSEEAVEPACEVQGPSAGSQLGMHAADMPEGVAAALAPTLEPLTAAAPVLFLRACHCSRAGTGAGGRRLQGATDGGVRCSICREDGLAVGQYDAMWGAVGVAREITWLRARMTGGGLVPGPGAGAAAAEFLTDLGLLLDAAACTAMREEDRAAGGSGRYGDTGTSSATQMSQEGGDVGEWQGGGTEKMCYEEQVRAVLLAQLGGGAGGLGGGCGGEGAGASLLAPPLGQHLADTAVTLLAACTEMSLPYTARLVMQLAARQLQLAEPEVLLQAAADGDVSFVFRLRMLLAEAELPPASHTPPPIDALHVGEAMAVAVPTQAPEGDFGTAAGASVVPVPRVLPALKLPAQEHADEQEIAMPEVVPKMPTSDWGCNVAAHDGPRAHGLLPLTASQASTSPGVVPTSPLTAGIHLIAGGTPLPAGLFSFPPTGTQLDAVDLATASTTPVFQSQPCSECLSTVALDEPLEVLEDTDVATSEGAPTPARYADCGMADAMQLAVPPRPSEVGYTLAPESELSTRGCFKAGSHVTGPGGWAPAGSSAGQVQGRGPMCNELLQQFGEQVRATIMGATSPAMEQAFWRDTAAGLQGVSRLYAYITLALVSISAIRAGLEDGLNTALFMGLYQGGQAALLAAYGKWGHGLPNRLFSAVVATVICRSACHALMSWGLAPLPSFVRPVARAWGDILNEAGAKAVIEQLPFWMYMALLVFLELPMVYALYGYLDGHGQGLLTRSVPMRLVCFVVLKTSVTVAAQAVMRLRFQARLTRAKCE